MCIFYRHIDEFLEGKSSPCYCQSQNQTKDFEERNNGISDTLFGRKNVFREMGFLGNTPRKSTSNDLGKTRWSDCGCESCVSWMNNGGDQKLHVVVKNPSKVFPELVGSKYRLFAVDLLGFGSSPKPRECLYTLNDHVEMVEKSVIREFDLNSFHLVAHSMGCIIALALAAKYPNNLKSITLVAPPYFLSSEEEDASEIALKRLAYKSVWPPLLFGSAFMTWKLSFLVIDLFRHTHHSAWHTMHNVICGGAKMMDPCLETLRQVQARVTVVQGSRDQVVPVECGNNIKVKVPDAEVKIIIGANHTTVIIGREKQFAADLELILDSANDAKG
ncbi:hypothetical protein L1987_76631 [Smallanthus sonchifolius]|uniref:Uncharacterized protein n=1 Tax=Smallanthus sonchifolius TaxID=185202 RepID=A0ACB8Z6R2_9ASTR|nr:hypothetical protein L1987_76631 [Smallanthus sonchifolius]